VSINDYRRRTDPPERSKKYRPKRAQGWKFACRGCGETYFLVFDRSIVDPPAGPRCLCGMVMDFTSTYSAKKALQQSLKKRRKVEKMAARLLAPVDPEQTGSMEGFGLEALRHQ